MNNLFGTSIGFKWFRVGRSQNGIWWIRVRLPFGIIISRRLGRFSKINQINNEQVNIGKQTFDEKKSQDLKINSDTNLSKNQELLNEIKNK